MDQIAHYSSSPAIQNVWLFYLVFRAASTSETLWFTGYKILRFLQFYPLLFDVMNTDDVPLNRIIKPLWLWLAEDAVTHFSAHSSSLVCRGGSSLPFTWPWPTSPSTENLSTVMLRNRGKTPRIHRVKALLTLCYTSITGPTPPQSPQCARLLSSMHQARGSNRSHKSWRRFCGARGGACEKIFSSASCWAGGNHCRPVSYNQRRVPELPLVL